MKVSRKYGFLRAVAFILKLLAWLVLLAGIAGGILALVGLGASLTPDLNLPGAVTVLGPAAVILVGVIWFIQLFAFGSILSLLIDIEENTRALAGQTPDN